MKLKRKNIELALVFGLIAAILLSFARFDSECEDLRRNVLRLHIIANSDSEEDQAIKLMIRDRIVKKSGDLFDPVGNLDAACDTAEKNLSVFTDIANDCLRENGFDYRANVTVGEAYFNTREYDTFTLPAGIYRSLNIKLGKASGKNWWCVIYPTVCLSAAQKHTLRETTDKHSAKMATTPKKYIIRFKSVEIYQKICRFFRK